MADSNEKLFSEFPAVSTEAWMEKVNADLKGADFEKKLVWKTNEGFKVQPFYREEHLSQIRIKEALPGEFPYVRGTKTDNHWLVNQEIVVNKAQDANQKALSLLTKGVDSITFVFSGQAFTGLQMEKLLDGIDPENIEINFRNCFQNSSLVLGLFVDYLKAKKIDPNKVKGSMMADPFRQCLIFGKAYANQWDEKAARLVAQSAELPLFQVLAAHPHLFNKAGSFIAQELGFGLAYGNAYLEALTEQGLEAGKIATKIRFHFGVSSDYFMEIAKFRAARLLWAKIVQAYLDGKACKTASKMKVHAFTSEWNQSIYDMYVNLLRSQTEAMSASIAGVDVLTVQAFDKAFKTPDDFSERIARNQQLLLREEAGFSDIVDPSAGSYYIENLTMALAGQAWKYFLAVQEKGGFTAALREAYIQDEVNASNQKRLGFLAQRREVLLGTNQYPNYNEAVADRIETEPTTDCNCADTALRPLNFNRGASAFESLRLATEKSGKRPKVFLLTIGNLNMRLARAQFSGNFFACAGYEIIDNLGFKTIEEGVKAARAAKADIVVLCSSDEEYIQLAPEAFAALDREILVIAGNPECSEDLKAQGITNFIHVRSNLLESLQAFNKQLNID